MYFLVFEIFLNKYSPAWYHEHHSKVDGSADFSKCGYPANIQIITLDGVDQAILNRNAWIVDSILNQRVIFPPVYKNAKYRPININTALMFYRDWLKKESYLLDDPSWSTYCSANKSLVANVMLNLPHNEQSFIEVYGSSEGSTLWELFKNNYLNLRGLAWVDEKETHFEPLWKKQNFTPKQIKPLTKSEYDAYYKYMIKKGSKPDFLPLTPAEATGWGIQTSADIMYFFIQIYADFIDAGAINGCQLILGFMPTVEERMGIGKIEYLLTAMPIIEKTMIADAKTKAATYQPQAAYITDTFQQLYLAYGGKPSDTIDFDKEMQKIKKFTSFVDFVKQIEVQNILPSILAAWSLKGVVENFKSITDKGIIPVEEAYVELIESIQKDLQKAREVVISEPDKVQDNIIPPTPHLISNGMFASNQYVTVKDVCTIMDYTELEPKK